MRDAAANLRLYEAILELIDDMRRASGDDTLGTAIEQYVLDVQMKEIECDILENPGAIEPWLVRRRDRL